MLLAAHFGSSTGEALARVSVWDNGICYSDRCLVINVDARQVWRDFINNVHVVYFHHLRVLNCYIKSWTSALLPLGDA